MKQGDHVLFSGPGLPPTEGYISEIDGDKASIWWPCSEFGRHTKIVPLALLTLMDDKNSEARHKNKPRRTKDILSDHQLIT